MPQSRATARRALLGVAVLAAAALLGVSAWNHWRVVGQSRAVAEGQSVRIGRALLDRLDGTPLPAEAETLATVRGPLSAEGLHWLAVQDGDALLVQTGARVRAQAALPTPAAPFHLRGTEAYGLLLVDLLPPAAGGPVIDRPPKTHQVVYAFEPSLALALQRQSQRTLLASLGVALLLVGVAITAYRSWVRADETEAAAVETRHLAALGQVSAVMAHEIRNPLAALKGHAQLLAEVLDEHPRLERRAIRVVDEAVRLEKITNDLLDFARTASLHRLPADPAALARAVAVDTDPSRVHVVAEGAPEAWSVDADKLRQVLLNLVQNALSMDRGGHPVDVGVTVSDRELQLTVRDRGPGLPDGDREQLFQPFFTTRTRGTGLGLPVSRRLVRLHGGQLSADNHPDGGAVFTITIPEETHGAPVGRR